MPRLTVPTVPLLIRAPRRWAPYASRVTGPPADADRSGQVDQQRPQVFVSYSRRDRAAVDELVVDLGRRGIDVWVDHTDLLGTSRWTAEIVAAIRRSQAFLVALSEAAVASEHVVREVHLAGQVGRPIFPVRLEPVAVPDDLAYYLAGRQRYDLFGSDRQATLDRLDRAVRAPASSDPERARRKALIRGAVPPPAGGEPRRRRRRWPLVAGGAVVLAAALGLWAAVAWPGDEDVCASLRLTLSEGPGPTNVPGRAVASFRLESRSADGATLRGLPTVELEGVPDTAETWTVGAAPEGGQVVAVTFGIPERGGAETVLRLRLPNVVLGEARCSVVSAAEPVTLP